MAKILLDYVFPITVIESIAAASTAWLKQVCIVVEPKSGQEGNVGSIFECISMTEVAARTDNTEAQQLFNAGMTKVFVLLADNLDLQDAMLDHAGEFYTVLISSDFDDDDMENAQADGVVTITNIANLVSGTDDTLTVGGVPFVAQAGAAVLGEGTFQAASSVGATAISLAAQINAHGDLQGLVTAEAEGAAVTITAVANGFSGNDIAVVYTDGDANIGLTLSGLVGGKLSGGTGLEVGVFSGVIGISSDDVDFLEAQAVIGKRCAFFIATANGAKNMFFAFGSLLSNGSNWLNQQYIEMPYDDAIDELGEAESLFDSRISFVIADDEFGTRLGMFAAGGKAIAAPYILKNLQIDLQSRSLSWIAANQPSYTVKEATLLETRLQEDVINDYIGSRKWISDGVVAITVDSDSNFVAAGAINVAEPKALWRVVSEMRQTL